MLSRLDDAERLADEALELGRGLRGVDPEGVHGVQMFSVRRAQGRLAEVAPALTTLARLGSLDAAWRPGLAVLYTELGMADEARRALEGLVTSEDVHLPFDARRGVSLSYLAEAAAFVGDPERAAVLYRHLEPYADTWISMHVIACYGPATRYLGLLAAVDPGRGDEAQAHLEDALARSQAGGSPPWAVHAAYDLAAYLARHGRPEDSGRAEVLARGARETAAGLGMAAIERRATQLLAGQLT